MSALEKLIVESCQLPMYDSSFRHFSDRKVIYTHTLKLNSDEPVTLNGKQITKARLIYTKRDIDTQNKPVDYQASETGVWQFTFADKTKVTQAANNDSILNCVTELQKRGATYRHFDQRISAGPTWNIKTMNQVYDINRDHHPADNYKRLHAFITSQIIQHVQEKQLAEVNIVDGGCGSGLFLKSFEAEVPASTTYHYLGFDFNPDNIAECNTDYTGKIQFRQGDLLNTDKILKDRKDCPTFLVLSGSLTRMVLHNGFEALQVLQKAASSNTDYLIGGGQGMPLVNNFIAKRVGYKMIFNNINDSKRGQSFFYEKMSPEEILQNKIRKIQTRKKLDLSLSPDPLQLLLELKKRNHLTSSLTIDFSYCPLSHDDILTIAAILHEYPDTQLVFWHWDRNLLKMFKQQFSAADVKKSSNDFYLTAPRDFFTSLNNTLVMPSRPSDEIDEVTTAELQYYVDTHNIGAIKSLLKNKLEYADLRTLRDQAYFRSDWEIAAILIEHTPTLGYVHNPKQKDEKNAHEIIKILARNKSYAALYEVLTTFLYKRDVLDSFLPLLEENNVDLSLIKNDQHDTLLDAVLSSINNRHYSNTDQRDPNNSAILQALLIAENGNTSLHKAVKNKLCNASVIKLLQMRKADPAMINRKGRNLLHSAAKANNMHMVKYLADHYPSLLHGTDWTGQTPAHYLIKAYYYQADDLKVLKDNSADLCKPDNNGNTPLHTYINWRKHYNYPIDVLDFYLKHYPALFHQRNADGKSIINIAIAQKDTEALAWLLNHKLLQAGSQYRLFRPAELQLNTVEVIPVGNFGVIDSLRLDTANNEITTVKLHYQGSEKLPTEMQDYLQREVSGLNIYLNEATKMISIENSYSNDLDQRTGTIHTYDLLHENTCTSSSSTIDSSEALSIIQITQALAILEKVSAITTPIRLAILNTVEQFNLCKPVHALR